MNRIDGKTTYSIAPDFEVPENWGDGGDDDIAVSLTPSGDLDALIAERDFLLRWKAWAWKGLGEMNRRYLMIACIHGASDMKDWNEENPEPTEE